ncbi:MAG: glycoside hydrolase family 15 protein [Opitutales bacterium]|nr:glycoside hydrolase family 15 protein [Opitutales bacterium]
MHNPDPDPYPPIEDYGIIGDLWTVALVGNGGSLEYLCFPHFDSPSLFAAHVDRKKGGRWQIEPLLDDFREKKLYLPDTNILLARFLSQEGIAEISNYMVVDQDDPHEQALVRRVKCVHGEVSFRMHFQPAFNYGRTSHRVTKENDQALIFHTEESDGLRILLQGTTGLAIKDGVGYAEFCLKAGEKITFVMQEAPEEGRLPVRDQGYSIESFKKTSDYWRKWISRCSYDGRWREAVHRSALALKLLTSREHGSILAAPCFGFPNEIGGERNWDYRYTWSRDASFTTYAFLRLGYTEEANGFMQWLQKRIDEWDGESDWETMFCLDGQALSGETQLTHFEGYQKSQPVRIGSTNHSQRQLDVFGELMDAVYLFDKYGPQISHRLWQGVHKMVDFVLQHWSDPDASIWEVRSGNREFLFSRVMCWVALDRAIRLANKRGLPAPLEKWRSCRDEIYQSVFQKFWNEDRRAFVQFKGAKALDASSLIMPLVRFISPEDPQWQSTLQAIVNDLVEDSLVYRYRVGEAFSDELEGGEGTFSICSFWLVECISRSGDLPKARYLFEKMLGYASPLGLFSEQLGPRGEFLGNVPQAFTHLAMISAAFDLDRRLSEKG